MSGQQFAIQHVVFDLDFFSKEKAYDLQNRVSRLFSQHLAGVMQQVFNKTVPEDLLLKGDRILLDIGTVRYENFEKEVSAGLEKALIDFFSAFLKQATTGYAQETAAGLSLLPLGKNYLSLFENFLFTGALPFYAATGGVSGLEKNLDELFDAEPEKLVSLLLSAGQSEWVRKRLAYQFSEPFIEKAIRLLEPAEARFIIAYKNNVGNLHQRSPVVTADAQSFHKELWVFILTFLLVEKGSLFSRKEFARSTFKKIAAHFGIRYNDLLALLKEGLADVNAEVNKSELLTLMNILTAEETATRVNEPASKQTGQALLPEPESLPLPVPAGEEQVHFSSPVAEKETTGGRPFSSNGLRWLWHYIKHGSLPAEAAGRTRSELRELFLSLLHDERTEVHKLLSSFSTVLVQKRSAALGINYTAETGGPSLPLPKDGTDTGSFTLTEQPARLTAQYKEDLLYHFLDTGFLPWWASPPSLSLQGLLEDLYVSSPQITLRLLKWAGGDGKRKVRFINQCPFSLFIKIAAALPDGREATAAFEKMSRLWDNESTSPPPAVPFVHLLWNNYILHDYQRFDEDLFFIEGVKAWAGIHHIPEEVLQLTLVHLIEKKNIAGLQRAVKEFGLTKESTELPWVPFNLSLPANPPPSVFSLSPEAAAPPAEGMNSLSAQPPGTRAVRQVEMHPLPSSPLSVSEEELIAVLLAGTDEHGPAPYEQTSGTGAAGRLRLALLDHVEYFFRHRSLPYQTEKKTKVSPYLFCKAALLLLYKTAEGEAEKLVSRYSNNAGLKQLMAQGFDRNDYREKAVLLWLNKLVIRHSRDEQEASADGIVGSPDPFTEGEKETAPALSRLQQRYAMESHSPGSKAATARLVLQHFLAWQTLPPAETKVANASPDEILKEVVFFLFVSDRTTLQTLLQNKTALPQAVIRLAGLFKTEKGGTESLLRLFLQPYVRDAALDCLWENATESEAGAADRHAPPPAVQRDVLALLNTAVSQGNVQDGEREAGAWLDHFLTHNRLPHILGHYREEDAVMAAFLFLARRATPLLRQILQKEAHHVEARMKLYEWVQKNGSSAGKEGLPLTEERVQKNILAYLREASQTLPEGMQNSLHRLWKSGLAPQKKQAFIQAVVRYPAAREEWVKTVPIAELFSVLKEMNPAAAKQCAYIINVMTRLVVPLLQQGYEQDNFTLQCKAFLLLMVAGAVTFNQPVELVHRFFRYVDNRRPSYVPRLYQALQRSWAGATEAMTIEPLIKKEIQKAIGARLASTVFPGHATNAGKKETQSSVSTQQNSAPSRTVKTTGDATATNRPNTAPAQGLAIESGTKLYVANAGLVLLHPFISTYLTLTGLVEKNGFVNEEARQRAVLLLQYAVLNTTHHEEQTLVLNKLLCDLPLEEPVPASLSPTDTEIKTTAELFAIVLQRWERMKNTSAEGFRQSFLQREGRLTKGEKAWTLRVEQKGYDVILQTLPWAFGLVKLPWMPLAIETEWI